MCSVSSLSPIETTKQLNNVARRVLVNMPINSTELVGDASIPTVRTVRKKGSVHSSFRPVPAPEIAQDSMSSMAS